MPERPFVRNLDLDQVRADVTVIDTGNDFPDPAAVARLLVALPDLLRHIDELEEFVEAVQLEDIHT